MHIILLCFILVIFFIMGSSNLFTYILGDCFTDSGALTASLPVMQL